MPPVNPTYWRKKLSALMHDSPGKVLQIWDHYQRATALQLPDRFEDYEHFDNKADHDASASDRLPFPKPIRSSFDGINNYFRHPLGGNAPLKFDIAFQSVAQAEESGQATRPTLINDDDPRGEFFARWRFWRWWASHRDPRLAFMPAETRLPDHTIWSHLFVTSAFQGCSTDRGIKPSLLLFTLGPAQSFISEARSTRDLWSGSYLISYLIGSVIKKLALEIGPDNFLFPNLCGQPIFDLLLKEEIWSQISTSSSGNAWDCFGYDISPDGQDNKRGKRRLLTPSLPNRFLLLVPSDRTQEIGEMAVATFNEVRSRIASSVQSLLLEKLPNISSGWNQERFGAQVERMLMPQWQSFAWPSSIDEVDEIASILPDDETAASYRAVTEMARNTPNTDRDSRYFKADGSLSNVNSGHSIFYHFTNLLLDGVKSSGAFNAWANESSWHRGKSSNKDYLNGKEEILFCPSEHEDLGQKLGRELFKQSEKPGLGASSLIKRLWHYSYLEPTYGFTKADFSMPSTRGISNGEPFSSDDDESENSPEQENYYAVIALDGDEMGKWIAGVKNPTVREQLSKEASDYFENRSQELEKFLDARRPLSPSFHLQFSESLANFSLYCAARIVESFNGRLIYAGGDDVLAMVPASKAIDCATSLRDAFRGNCKALNNLNGTWEYHSGKAIRVDENRLFDCAADGYLRIHQNSDAMEEEPKKHQSILPGPATDISVGIAIGHEKDPLQRIVQAAQICERKAKSELGRSALFTQVVKRSGEIIEWGCKWESNGIDFLGSLLSHMISGKLAARFPYKLIGLLQPYLPAEGSKVDDDAGFEDSAFLIVERELQDSILSHWQGPKDDALILCSKISEQLEKYWNSVSESAVNKVGWLTNLLRTLAWLSKKTGGKQ
jgi:CRISPR-associated protein Cmr2